MIIEVECETCAGFGWFEDTDEDCDECDGNGYIEEEDGEK